MTHKDKMNWLKENDPITYYEMTSNPTGSDSSGEGCLVLIVILGFIFLFSILFRRKRKNKGIRKS